MYQTLPYWAVVVLWLSLTVAIALHGTLRAAAFFGLLAGAFITVMGFVRVY